MKETPEQSNKQEKASVILIKRSIEAPAEAKENPFYDPESWGRAKSPEEIYLPDSDEVLSFALAAHEIGHLVEASALESGLDDFESGKAEELRAWEKGWIYLKKYFKEYYQEQPEMAGRIEAAYEEIKDLSMQAVDLSREMYVEKGSLENLSEEDYKKLIKEKRRELFNSEAGEKILAILEKIKSKKIGIKTDWDKFVVIVKKAVEEILKDNEKPDL